MFAAVAGISGLFAVIGAAIAASGFVIFWQRPRSKPLTRLIHFAPMNELRANVAELSVSELSASLKRTVEDTYGYVRVRGEISGYRGPHSSGHVYLALKDERAKIDGVIWKGVFGRMRIKPEEGMEVIVTGRLTTYPNRSSYQIVIETLEPAGLGALMALLEERRQKLAAEGLFDPARKQLLPFLPEVIGVVTSPTGRRDPRHPAPAFGPISAPRHRLAGAGPGRRAPPPRSPPRSMASTPCPRPVRSGVRTSSSSRAAAVRWRTCGHSTRKSWCARPPTA